MSNDLEKFWNEKHPQQRLIYGGRTMSKVCHACKSHTVTESMPLDVRNLISADDVMLQELIAKNNLKGASHDDTMMRIQKFVCSFLTYVGDDEQQGSPEYWQFAFETLYSKLGDCEDGAILITSLGINAGVPPFRLRVAAGLVQPEKTAPEGGHGYCVYLRESNDWTILDWCYFQNPNVAMKDKPIAKEDTRYKEVWFSFNNQFAWSNTEFEIPNKIKDK